MKYSELIKSMKKAGCTLIRHGTNHDEWYRPTLERRFEFLAIQARTPRRGSLRRS